MEASPAGRGKHVDVPVVEGDEIVVRRESLVLAAELELVDRDLAETALALRPRGGFADLLHGGHQQRDEDRDDRDDHEQFNQGEPSVRRRALNVNSIHHGCLSTKTAFRPWGGAATIIDVSLPRSTMKRTRAAPWR